MKIFEFFAMTYRAMLMNRAQHTRRSLCVYKNGCCVTNSAVKTGNTIPRIIELKSTFAATDVGKEM